MSENVEFEGNEKSVRNEKWLENVNSVGNGKRNEKWGTCEKWDF